MVRSIFCKYFPPICDLSYSLDNVMHPIFKVLLWINHCIGNKIQKWIKRYFWPQWRQTETDNNKTAWETHYYSRPFHCPCRRPCPVSLLLWILTLALPVLTFISSLRCHKQLHHLNCFLSLIITIIIVVANTYWAPNHWTLCVLHICLNILQVTI